MDLSFEQQLDQIKEELIAVIMDVGSSLRTHIREAGERLEATFEEHVKRIESDDT